MRRSISVFLSPKDFGDKGTLLQRGPRTPRISIRYRQKNRINFQKTLDKRGIYAYNVLYHYEGKGENAMMNVYTGRFYYCHQSGFSAFAEMR